VDENRLIYNTHIFNHYEIYMDFIIIVLMILSIYIIVSCAYYKELKEGLTNNKTFILIGDSVLNNSNYVSEGKSVAELLQKKSNSVINVAKDHATIQSLYQQLEKIPSDLDKESTNIFISAGGNDILNKNGRINVKQLFVSYKQFLEALKAKFQNAQIHVLNLYLPINPKYQKYKPIIDEWNRFIDDNSTNIGEMYNVIHLNDVLKSGEDFIDDIEPSEIASEKIANLLYLS